MRTGFTFVPRFVPGFVLAIVLGACGSDGGGGDDGPLPPDGAPATPPAFQLESPEAEIMPGQEVTLCWYFRTSNTRPAAINRWASTMTPGSHHLIVYTTQTDVMAPGTMSALNCDARDGFAAWTYSAQTPDEELKLPADDGEGKPLAMEIAANQAGFIQIHFLNTTDQPIRSRVAVSAYALDEGAAYTRTAAHVTYNGNISIPPMTMGHVEAMTCNVPTTSKFWMMTTHAHRRAVRTVVRDGLPATGTAVFESTDWEHPGATRWEAPYHSFASGKLTYECTYDNPSNRTIRTGASAQADEMCMSSGYFFPATKPVFCFNNITL